MDPRTLRGRESVSPAERSWHGAPPPAEPARSDPDEARDPYRSPSPTDQARPRHRRFAFRFEPRYRVAAVPFSVNADHAYVEIDLRSDADEHGVLRARFGPWMVETPLDNVEKTHATGPYRVLKTIGPARLSLADRGLTFATNHDRGVCIAFREPVTGIDPFGLVRHPALTVTVADVEGLRTALSG